VEHHLHVHARAAEEVSDATATGPHNGVVRAYRAVCVEVIRRFEGHLAKYLGDGVLVYFGYPQAHEDDAQRAVRVGLALLAELPALNARLAQTLPAMRDLPLQARIGIHTGPVIVGAAGAGFTVSVFEPVAVQPLAFETVTVYVVVVAGDTVICCVVCRSAMGPPLTRRSRRDWSTRHKYAVIAAAEPKNPTRYNQACQ